MNAIRRCLIIGGRTLHGTLTVFLIIEQCCGKQCKWRCCEYGIIAHSVALIPTFTLSHSCVGV